MASLLLLNPVKKHTRKRSHKPKSKRSIRRNPVGRISRIVRRFKARRAAKKAAPRVIVLKSPVHRKRGGRARSTVSGIMERAHKAASRDNLKLAAGAIASAFVSKVVIDKLGSHLPGIKSPVGRMAYVIGAPIVAAALIRKIDPKLSDGFVLGGVIAGLTEAIKIASGGKFFSEYLDAGEMAEIDNLGADPDSDYIGAYLDAPAEVMQPPASMANVTGDSSAAFVAESW